MCKCKISRETKFASFNSFDVNLSFSSMTSFAHPYSHNSLSHDNPGFYKCKHILMVIILQVQGGALSITRPRWLMMTMMIMILIMMTMMIIIMIKIAMMMIMIEPRWCCQKSTTAYNGRVNSSPILCRQVVNQSRVLVAAVPISSALTVSTDPFSHPSFALTFDI